jgi:hypothetical protein
LIEADGKCNCKNVRRAMSSMLFVALVASCLPLSSAFAMPPNPERLFDEKTCDDALRRRAEAQAGNPLITPERNRQVWREASRHARQLCAAEGRSVPGDTAP